MADFAKDGECVAKDEPTVQPYPVPVPTPPGVMTPTPRSGYGDILAMMQTGWLARGNQVNARPPQLPGNIADQLAGLFGGGPGRVIPPMSPGIGYGIPMPVQYEDLSYGAPSSDPIAALFAAWMNNRYPSPY